MARSRRPELEKDNPVAPQIYSRRGRTTVSARRRRKRSGLETLLVLTEAAEAFVNRTPRSQKTETARRALLDAITKAQLMLSDRGH